MKGVRRNGLYVLIGSSCAPGIMASVSKDKTKLWHMSEKGRELDKQGLIGYDQISSLKFCEKCVFGKATRQKFGTGKQETKNSMDYIHSDLWGPSQVPSEEIEKLKSELRSEFEMKDLGFASKILGMHVKRDRAAKTLFLTQAGYVRKVLNKFEIVNVKEVSTSLATHFKLSKQQKPSDDTDIEYMKKVPYSSVVGSIMYAIVCTRPDIAYSVGLVSIFMGNLGKTHWNAAKWTLRYLKGTSLEGIMVSQVKSLAMWTLISLVT